MHAIENEASPVTTLIGFARRQNQLNPTYRHPLDRRSDIRHSVIEPATIRPVTYKLVPLDESIDVVTRNISQSGIGLVMDQKPVHEFYTVRVSIGEDKLFCLCMVIWCEPRGPFEFVGMEVVRPLQ